MAMQEALWEEQESVVAAEEAAEEASLESKPNSKPNPNPSPGPLSFTLALVLTLAGPSVPLPDSDPSTAITVLCEHYVNLPNPNPDPSPNPNPSLNLDPNPRSPARLGSRCGHVYRAWSWKLRSRRGGMWQFRRR